MNNKRLQILTLVLLLLLMMLATAFTVRAEENHTIITNQQEIELEPAEKTSSYVYLTAEVPAGWGGDIEVNFHNEATDKDYKVTMNYIIDGYNSGLWLPFGLYGVEARQPDPDGLCTVQLENSEQKRIQVRKDENSLIRVMVVENPEFDTTVPAMEDGYHPPKEDTDYQDLPTVPVNIEEEDPLETTDTASQEEESISGRVVRVFSIILVVLLLLIVVWYFIMEYQERNAED